MRWRSVLCIGGPLMATLAALPVNAQDAGWRYRRLDLEVELDPSRSYLEVRGHAVFEVTAPRVSELELGINTRALAMQFTRLTTPDLPAHVELTTDAPLHRARIALDSPLARGDSLSVEFTVRRVDTSFQLLVDDSIALASWVEAWYPIPLGPGGAMRSWSAAGRTRFHLPRGWRAVSNGSLLSSETLADSTVVEVWETADPVHRSFAAAPYQVSHAMTGERRIGVYLLRADSASARRQADVLARAIGAMEAVWGSYPYSGYAIAEIPAGVVTWGASSEQGFIMATTPLFGEDGNLPLFAHEAAHAWWGNRVNTTGPGSQLVSESLAQYGAVVAIESLEGTDAMNEFLRFSRDGYNSLQSAAGYFEIVRRGGDKPLSELSNGPWDHNLSDAKGHWFYHMLRHRIGEERFFAVLRDLQRDHAGRALSLSDLRAAFVDAVPADSALPGFMAQWLDRTGAPVLDHRWWSVDEGAAARLEITQLQPEPYDIALEVELQLLNGHRVRTSLHLRDRAHVFTIPVHARPVRVRIDPDHRLLHWRPEYGPPPLAD